MSAVKSKSKSAAPASGGYAGHKEGSRKGKVHALFDAQGIEAAWVLGRKLKLKDTTLRTWLSFWSRSQVKKKGKSKPKAAPKSKPAKKATQTAAVAS